MAAVVQTEGLTKDFPVGFWRPRPKRALDGLSLEIPAGGVFGLLGPNGAGKSTTLKLLLSLLRPTSGRAEVLGFPPGDIRARQRLGFLPENPTFYDHLSADEQHVFRCLSQFPGGFGLDIAVAACGLPADRVLALLSALVTKSLLTPAGGGRFEQLESVRLYGREKVAELSP